MTPSLLLEAAADIEARGRIRFADVRRLQRDVMPDGVTCREEAEVLIRLDRGMRKTDRAWGDWFVAVLVDYVVWSERPTGIVNEEAAMWLSEALDVPRPTRNARRLVDAIVAEAERVHESLTRAADDGADIEIIVSAPQCQATSLAA